MDVLERIPNREQRWQVEATYWTWRVLGVFPDGTAEHLKPIIVGRNIRFPKAVIDGMIAA